MGDIVSVDPGWSTGVVVVSFTEDLPMTVRFVGQYPGGTRGITAVVRQLHDEYPSATWISEAFTVRPGSRGMRLRDVEPLRIEGFLIGLGLMPDRESKSDRWRQPQSRLFAGGSTPAERQKNAIQFLRDHGLHVTGRDVGQPDADDANSALLHALAFLKYQKHRPTINTFFH